MSKKKRRKKTRTTKHPASRMAVHRAGQMKHSKAGKHQLAHATAEPHSVALLRAMRRRREAQFSEHHGSDGTHGTSHPAHTREKTRRKPVHSKHHHGEPVITEKSFENMLAFRRFQNHAR